DALKWLDEIAADESVRGAIIVGLGGTGKTALIHHWVHKRRGYAARASAAALDWTFDDRHDTAQLIETLIGLGSSALRWAPPRGVTRLEAVNDLITTRRLLLVLDGVERLQSTTDSAALGSLIDETLRQLLLAAVRPGGSSLVVVTSRLPIVDIESALGRSA